MSKETTLLRLQGTTYLGIGCLMALSGDNIWINGEKHATFSTSGHRALFDARRGVQMA